MIGVVALCARLAEHGLAVGAIQERLSVHGVGAIVVEDLCADPEALGALAGAESWVVVAVCPDGPSHDEVAARTRRAGSDPGVGSLRLDLVRVSGFGDPRGADARAEAALLAASARLASARESSAAAFRMELPGGEVSRRSLFSLARTSYVPVAVVGLDGCHGSTACGLCADACPARAISVSERMPQVDKSRCVGCAACVTACPVDGAVHLPGADLVGFERQLSTLVEEQGDAGVLIACRRSPAVPPARLPGTWGVMEVPCLSVVTSGWALGVLGAGARAVAFRGCGDACTAQAPERIAPRVDFARDALRAVGIDDAESRVRLVLPPDDRPVATQSAPDTLSEVAPHLVRGKVQLREPAATVSPLAGFGSPMPDVLPSRGSATGIVDVSTEGCTVCGLCASACPTSAFRFDEGPIAAVLDLDRDRCVGCGHCVTICPEQVVTVEQGLDLARAGHGRRAVKRSAMARCRECGDPIASSAMLERIRAMLPDDPAIMSTIEGLCLGCRGR